MRTLVYIACLVYMGILPLFSCSKEKGNNEVPSEQNSIFFTGNTLSNVDYHLGQLPQANKSSILFHPDGKLQILARSRNSVLVTFWRRERIKYVEIDLGLLKTCPIKNGQRPQQS